MAEYIEREALIKAFQCTGSVFVYGIDTIKAIVNRIKLQPAADVVEVVRCKDCYKYFRVIGRDEREVWGCRHFGSIVKADDFCSYGERKDGAEDDR